MSGIRGIAGLLVAFGFLLGSCGNDAPSTDSQRQQEVGIYLEEYNDRYQERYYTSSKVEWRANTHIVEGDTATANTVRRANEALAEFTGSRSHIREANRYLDQAGTLTDLQIRQLRAIIYLAADNPQSVDSLVSERIELENELNRRLFGFDFRIGGESVSTNEIDRILRESEGLSQRLEAWEASKEVGRELREGLSEIRSLRNRTVDALGFRDFFTYQVYDYGMSSEEMMELMTRARRQLFPLYRELHTWARYELAERYGREVPEMLPAHWLPNRWGEDWSALVGSGGGGLDSVLEGREPEEIVRMGEDFYRSLGFGRLPQVFWERSSLYPLPDDAAHSKNNHASAWHMNLDDDLRALMSVEPNSYWYETVHHELGHIYYYLAYSRPEVPVLLRRGANRAFHEAVGSLMGMASMQQPFLQERGLYPGGGEAGADPEMRHLLREALNYVVSIPFAAGVMSEFEHEIYAGELPAGEFNRYWWEMKRRYQGIVPPGKRDSTYADAASKPHIINDPAQYYDYALSNLMMFQLHAHISREILDQDPRATSYYGSEETGDFLRGLMRPGATADGRELLKRATGSEISAQPMLDYFRPLLEWLREQNRGRSHTLQIPN